MMEMRRPDRLTRTILDLLEEDPGMSVKEMAQRLRLNRTFLSGYLTALENEGRLRSKNIGPARAYFNDNSNSRGNRNAK